jgi:hypothetical protein
MRAFVLIRDIETEIAGVTHVVSRVEFLNGFNRTHYDLLYETRAFFEIAAVGDVFQMQHNEYIVALGSLIQASWLK